LIVVTNGKNETCSVFGYLLSVLFSENRQTRPLPCVLQRTLGKKYPQKIQKNCQVQDLAKKGK
jgi:hypothetical protein